MIRHTVTVMGKEVAYWERNPSMPRTIVMLHGFRGNHKGLTDMVQHFPGFRLIMPDLPGYGESETLFVPHTLTNYARWLDEFVGELDLEDWVSWSHSYSGSIALIQAAEGAHKPAAVVSVSLAAVRRDVASAVSTLYYWVGQFLPHRVRRRWIASRTVDHATGRWLFMTATTRRRKALMRRGDRNLPILNVQVVTEEYMSARQTPLEPYAAAVDMPVLIVAGARDIIVPLKQLEQLVSLMPDGALTVMEDQGHLAPIERPAATATITKRFINGLEGSRP
ncbi:MAG: Hydrolase [Patescibacteria group bacterium]|jgi:pimeloyl-ACP methyl ester carboxylesterase|nr:Hydrolase [Patescibacteria group bacterium]